jgi:tetraprenyl-beta-curcumene synthase
MNIAEVLSLNPMNHTMNYPNNPFSLMNRVYRHILPGVRSELTGWRKRAEVIPDPELRAQAIASISTKEFHCQGGSVYAAAHLAQKEVLIALIVAFQTISDYLDNLCDRSTSLDPDDFRRLHQSMLDAVTPEAEPADYYAFRNEKEDGGYLLGLVDTCRSCIRRLPSYDLVAEDVRRLVTLYCDLQVYKHIRRDLREEALTSWWDRYKSQFPEIYWNEFAAATGSTLGVFMLFLAASDPELPHDRPATIREAYFPYVCGLHILLDYLIDQEEDREGGDLNFCFYYRDRGETVERIASIVLEARKAVVRLEAPRFHRMIIEGLLALYLSDPKVREQPEVRRISIRLMHKSPLTRLFFWVNSIWIRTESRHKR